MIKFPKIGQFRDVVSFVRKQNDFKGFNEEGQSIFNHDTLYPKLTFTGTPKLHGTNSSVVYSKSKDIIYQSRNNEITVLKDNAGFAAFMSGISIEAKQVLLNVFNKHICSTFVYFGEFCGNGIQKGVAIEKLPKMFVIFNFKKDDDWLLPVFTEDELSILNKNKIYSILQFESYEMEIDFEHPELAQNKLKELTNQVENECPVGKYFGILGTGEGIVWKNKYDLSPKYWFKVKGMKHSSSKVKTLASVNVEKVNNIQEFVEMTVTESRLEQGLSILKEQGKEIHRKNTGEFLKWIVSDIISEELDTLTKNNLCAKDVTSELSKKARIFWLSQTDKL